MVKKPAPFLIYCSLVLQGQEKTTLAKALLHELGVDWGDVLEINASSENGVDYIRDTITSFATCVPFGEFKYVLLDEADYLSPNAQAAFAWRYGKKFNNVPDSY